MAQQGPDLIFELLVASGAGLTRAELLAAVRERSPGALASQVERFVRAAGDRIKEVEGRLVVASASEGAEELSTTLLAPPDRPLRVVAVDLESVVRLVAREPYTERHLFQLGAVRLGRDRAWVKAGRLFNSFLAMSAAAEELLISERVRAAYSARSRPAAEVLESFRSFCSDADALVAYNGTELDFELLRQEYARAGLSPLEGHVLVDGYYLALALWPVPPRQHRLRQLADRLQLDVGDARWHDALDDAKVLALLLQFGAEMVAGWEESIRRLVVSASQGSPAWELLLSLSQARVAPELMSAGEVSDAMALALRRKPPVRREPPTAGAIPPRPALALSESIIEDDARDRVDVTRLAMAAKGVEVEPRRSQRDMVERMRGWVAVRRSALVEAPTGTGKSYAMQAVALEWLAADPENRVVISTFTKQLQSQLAADLQALSENGVLPQLREIADMIKGSANRLSLRALVRALADLTAPTAQPRPGRRTPADLAADPRFRELTLYLALRLVAEGNPVEEWESRSVDPADVPAFFDQYSQGRRALFLRTLSQASSGEMGTGTGAVAAHTTTVREALNSHRLAIANHALLLAHLDDFQDLGPRTLLMADEAHSLEDAATDALSARLEYQEVEAVARDVQEWLSDQPDRVMMLDIESALGDLEAFLDYENLPRAALRAFDTEPGDGVTQRLRKVTVASPLGGDSHGREMEALLVSLRTCYFRLRSLQLPVGQVEARADPNEQERLLLLRERLTTVAKAAGSIARDGHQAVGLDWPGEQDATAAVGPPALDAAAAPEAAEVAEDQPEPVAEEAAEEAELAVDAVALEMEEDLGNRVVWAEELQGGELARGPRYFRFTLGSSPIALGREPRYRQFKRTFGLTYFISATLRVADRWDYIRQRLDLPEAEIDAIALESPFDAASQARLVCFEDFPSWAEQAEMAVRTVAYQLAAYGREAMRGNQNGAMVLTTARESSARIADWLLRWRAPMGGSYPVTATELLGNQRAVAEFTASGGFLVGTRGLWQGVDVADPERLRMVWINKLPFASFADPVIEARRAAIALDAERLGAEEPDQFANEHYYLPMGALLLRQAVGRLIRTQAHRGVIVISDRKLAGPTRLRRLYRQIFLGSLDRGLLMEDPETGELGAGNVVTMDEGWRRIWEFLAEAGVVSAERGAELITPEALSEQTLLPEIRAIRAQALSLEELGELRAQGPEAVAAELVERGRKVGGYLRLSDEGVDLRSQQRVALEEVGRGKDVLAVLPTGYGKSFVFQLPALVLPGVTVVVSPLVSLMTDQALTLNRAIGGAVRALVAPMRESNSRTGKAEVYQQLTDANCRHGIRLVYMSPERLCQRQFQDWVRRAVELGIVPRIALDEAHTFAQWGDDFRPSFRRAEMFIRSLKSEHPALQLIALTATANRAVREDLIGGLFGRDPATAERDPNFALVTANPIRPELAVYRRRLGHGEGGNTVTAGLVERVVETLDDHAIIYCLTVKQVEAVHSHLADFLGDQRDRLRKYHGRMTEAEKAAAANDFKQAPARGEEGFRPMLVVATSAFGLGVDRPDIRTVFVVSPPTDLAALYQQLGRAGRDQTGKAAADRVPTRALALADSHAFRVIRFMNRRRTEEHVQWRIAGEIVARERHLDSRELARTLVQEDLDAGRLRQEDIDNGVEGQYRIEVMRVLAALAADGVIDDLGDFPARVDVRPGDVEPDTAEMAEMVASILDARPSGGATVEVDALYQALGDQLEGEVADAGGLWSLLLQLHAGGYLDVSQRPNIGGAYLTGVRPTGKPLGEQTIAHLSARQRAVEDEYGFLAGWFDSTGCCNDGFREYFGAPKLPEGTCATPECRCSACWSRADAGGAEPTALAALATVRPQPASRGQAHRRRQMQRLDRYVEQLLWQNPRGLAEGIVHTTLRGESTYFSLKAKKRVLLWPKLAYSRLFNVRPGLRRDELQASLARLDGADVIVRNGGLWRLRRYVERDQERAAAGLAGAV